MWGKKVLRKTKPKWSFLFKQTSHRFYWYPVFHLAICLHVCLHILKNEKTSSQGISKCPVWSPSGDPHRFNLYPQSNFLCRRQVYSLLLIKISITLLLWRYKSTSFSYIKDHLLSLPEYFTTFLKWEVADTSSQMPLAHIFWYETFYMW